MMTEAGPEGDRLRLMVVDDEKDNLDLLHRTFRRDFEVFRADSGLQALQILEEHGEMSIIISDQRMPRMNGTEFLSRTVERFPDTIRILLTGYTDVEDLVGAINAGKVFKYITKPWNPREVKTIVTQAADTYRVVKQRTNELHRALRRESIFNTITTAIRESLDYRHILQAIVQAIGQAFHADICLLRSMEEFSIGCPQPQLSTETFVYSTQLKSEAVLTKTVLTESGVIQDFLATCAQGSRFPKCQAQLQPASQLAPSTRLLVPLIYQQEMLAILLLYQQGSLEPWSAEDVQLIEGVSEQAALAIAQAKLYQQVQKQTDQIRAELAVARQIQTNLLRQTLPHIDTATIQAHCFPAREIGGDFFEIYVHPQGDVWLAVGDVSGKGVPAALFMASAISLLRRELAQESSPAPQVVMQNLNHSLSDDLVSSNCFITMVLARYTPATGELFYANAGHIYPMVWSQHRLLTEIKQSGAVTFEPDYLKVRGVPLGILPVWKAQPGQLILGSGDVFLLTSDGLTEATFADRGAGGHSTMLHQAGLWQLLTRQQGGLNLKDLLSVIQAQTQVQEDDQTILSLEVL